MTLTPHSYDVAALFQNFNRKREVVVNAFPATVSFEAVAG